MFEVHCHIHESSVLLDWSRSRGDAPHRREARPRLALLVRGKGSLIGSARSEPRPVEAVVIDLFGTDGAAPVGA
jgi:hypothetical protein